MFHGFLQTTTFSGVQVNLPPPGTTKDNGHHLPPPTDTDRDSWKDLVDGQCGTFNRESKVAVWLAKSDFRIVNQKARPAQLSAADGAGTAGAAAAAAAGGEAAVPAVLVSFVELLGFWGEVYESHLSERRFLEFSSGIPFKLYLAMVRKLKAELAKRPAAI